METKEAATKLAEALKARLQKATQKVWEIRVWENMGWHYSVHCGRINLNPTSLNKDPEYFCLISDDDRYPTAGAGIWASGASTHKDPIVALQVAFDAVLACKERLMVSFNKVEEMNNLI